MGLIALRLNKLFGKREDNEISNAEAPEEQTEQDIDDLSEEDISDRVIVKYGSSFEETPADVVGSLVLVSRFKKDDGSIYEVGELQLGASGLVSDDKITTNTNSKTLVKHVINKSVSAEIGFLKFLSGSMSSESLAEAEIVQSVTASVSPKNIDSNAFKELIDNQTLPAHQYLAIVAAAAVVNSSARIFDKIGDTASAVYGVTISGKGYALSEYISNKAFLAVTPMRHFTDDKDIVPKLESNINGDTDKFLVANNVSSSKRLSNENLAQ